MENTVSAEKALSADVGSGKKIRYPGVDDGGGGEFYLAT